MQLARHALALLVVIVTPRSLLKSGAAFTANIDAVAVTPIFIVFRFFAYN